MKKLLFLACLLFGMNIKAQFVFEHDYPGASTFGSNGSQLMIINFEVSGQMYVNINRGTKNITIYNLNHSLVKTISLASLQVGIGSNHIDDILYLSQHLFNLDTMIEFMYIKDDGVPSQSVVWVYDETGAILFNDSAGVPIRNNVPLQQYPIYNTSQGTKMILSYKNGHGKVWGLAGTLTTAIQEANQNLLQSSGLISNPRPNPAINTTTIDYKIPDGVNQGEIVFYDLQGTEIKRFKVDKTFSSLLISTTDIPAGTYYYQLQTSGNTSAGKKMVVVK
jgi:hypothetical protein